MNREEIPAAWRAAVDTHEVTQLILRERESRDLGLWGPMRDCFHPDSRVDISWFQGDGQAFVAASADMARRGVLATHRLGPIRVRLGGDRAVATLGGAIDIPVSVGGQDLHLTSHARFLYRVERRAGIWRLASFEAVYQRDELRSVLPGSPLPCTAAELAGFRPAYRMLSWVLTQTGYAVNPHLAGEDRPESAAALYAAAFTWAGVEA